MNLFDLYCPVLVPFEKRIKLIREYLTNEEKFHDRVRIS